MKGVNMRTVKFYITDGPDKRVVLEKFMFLEEVEFWLLQANKRNRNRNRVLGILTPELCAQSSNSPIYTFNGELLINGRLFTSACGYYDSLGRHGYLTCRQGR